MTSLYGVFCSILFVTLLNVLQLMVEIAIDKALKIALHWLITIQAVILFREQPTFDFLQSK